MSSIEYRTFTFRTLDAGPVQLDLVRDTTAPQQQGRQKTLIFFHGGGLVSGNRRTRFPGLPMQMLLRRGWMILTADYHLLPESGVAEMLEDARHLEGWVLTEGRELGIDLDSLAVAGGSAGAFVACLALSAWTRLRPRAFYSAYGMLDTDSAWYATRKDDSTTFMGVPVTSVLAENSEQYLKPGRPPMWHDDTGLEDPRNRGRMFMWMLKEGILGGMITSSIKAATGKDSPIELVAPSFPPTVAIHGTADSLVPIAGARALVAALAAAGVESTLVEAEGADHGINPQEKYRAEIERSVDLVEGHMV